MGGPWGDLLRVCRVCVVMCVCVHVCVVMCCSSHPPPNHTHTHTPPRGARSFPRRWGSWAMTTMCSGGQTGAATWPRSSSRRKDLPRAYGPLWSHDAACESRDFVGKGSAVQSSLTIHVTHTLSLARLFRRTMALCSPTGTTDGWKIWASLATAGAWTGRLLTDKVLTPASISTRPSTHAGEGEGAHVSQGTEQAVDFPGGGGVGGYNDTSGPKSSTRSTCRQTRCPRRLQGSLWKLRFCHAARRLLLRCPRWTP